MNRSLPALILLLGTLGGSIVALGVARDLERVGRRPVGETQTGSTAQSVSFGQGRVTPDVTIRTESLSELPAAVQPPLRYEDDVDYVADAIDLLENTWLREATLIVHRSTADFSEAVADTTMVDALIAANDGVVEKDERDAVPYGFVAIGPERSLVALQHRGDAFCGVFLWTGSLHYGGNARQTLGSTVVTTTPVTQAAQPLPWDKLALWSSDRREWTARWSRWAMGLMHAGVTSIEAVGLVGDGAAWADRLIDRSWDRLTIHVKRELWLVNVPQFSVPMRSAELPQGDKR